MQYTGSDYQKIESILERFLIGRETTEKLCSALIQEDFMLSVTEDTSPAKWHLAHTTWFLENFILMRFKPGHKPFHEGFHFLFNSYYNSAGPFLPKSKRNAISRPSTEEIFRYRQEITFEVMDSLASLGPVALKEALVVLEMGIHHEQQHQELLLMDIKRNFFENPYRPAYQNISLEISPVESHQEWIHVPGGLCDIGVSLSKVDFAYDNEKDSHSRWIDGFMLSSHLVNNGEYLEFIEARGYENSLLWLSDGWEKIKTEQWSHPLYWKKKGKEWWTYTLSGLIPLDPSTPVSHISFYEASAFAKWKGTRLPTEFEWEISARMENSIDGHFMDENNFSPKVSSEEHEKFSQIHGSLWEWTSSSYEAYPRYQSLGQGLSEYNEKFMCNQFVLRGGSCVTPKSHYRFTYRNFYYPHNRWQFCGLRLAKDLV